MGREDGAITATPKTDVTVQDGVAIVHVGRPESPALISSVRKALSRSLDVVERSSDVQAIVITGAGPDFATGTGLSDATSDAPELATLCDRIEASTRPVVAAIAGAALGGGLELLMSAHLRVARPSARLGSPEITMGLLPAAGGTQRLPKLVGGVAALKILLSGKAVDGASAVKLGLVDVLAESDLIEEAVKCAKSMVETGAELMRSSTRRDRLGEGTAFLEAVASHRRVAQQSPLDAPLRIIECVEAALLLPYDVGRGMEQAAFEDLSRSEHAHALRHVFTCERRLKAATGWSGRTPSRELTSLAVVGARGVGSEFAVVCLDAGFNVILAEESDAALEDGVTRIIEHYDARVASGALSEEDVEATLDRMSAVSGYRTIAEADIVVDHAERMASQRLSALDAGMRAGAILATSAEGVDLNVLAEQTGRASDVVGLRMFPGLRKNRLVEVSKVEATGERALATVRALAQKLDRLIVETGAAHEGIGTRLAEAVHAAADLCVEDGASISQVDAALRDWGLPFGSFAWRDIVGVSRPSAPLHAEGQRGGGLDAVLAKAGRHGLAVGRGYYAYRQRGKPGVEDSEVTALIDADRRSKRVIGRGLSDGDVRKRVVAAMAGAGAQMLAEGTARRPADIDMVAIHGLGFARRTGGVMCPADLLGLETVSDILKSISQDAPRLPSPGGLLADLVRREKTFGDLNS